MENGTLPGYGMYTGAFGSVPFGYGGTGADYEVLKDLAHARVEQAKDTADIRKEVANESCGINSNVKDSSWHVSDKVGTEADRIIAQDTSYFIADQQATAANAMQLAAIKQGQDMSFHHMQASIIAATDKAVGASNLAAANMLNAVALGQAKIEGAIVSDGNSTRALVNQLKMDELNRMLLERNTAVAACESKMHNMHGDNNNLLWANVSSQLNALQSQVQETRQGLINFGTMAGVGMSSTSNNVR